MNIYKKKIYILSCVYKAGYANAASLANQISGLYTLKSKQILM